ncbi:4-aminobutyrate--2-oxoglutarate transaminase [Laribacter hongkongensis]|uniref:4-aminobutyrate--2-oxoglutarate transaminase n=1 Tax=Laribacter hongkongensis TaxID=168471 RepID=UPI001EFD035C|nr:4-aminobutyrate--2-oxoglutarate transaminase [Laribacter hongkongensis]MCG8992273.1 4-aminobutyrate--2-oxoglutarate transaminase [Laribacter hongkongensis]MCG8999032.1 4-aminobutyrate--2-oxoglutarate transaminase [Laribacter hongkongensis]MCG9001753.1 4-aminobutyrate--2-oxoglutarate transaminase [Laribacter hongkongensis]MCG9004969.1 4-aminobutyrate--2-oxoglutarate transaminase [Laribacter hongkongensis]MCG9007189.1 4-aminobutyrate--2-oxoglutarate transaminase [Laribacter hongkongensis]
MSSPLTERRQQATPRGVAVLCDFYADRACNAELWDEQGRRHIDFAGGIGVLNSGHLHPQVAAAVQAQMQRFSHTCYQVVPYALYVEVAERLNALVPGPHARKTAFFTSGAEAVENAVKIARAYTGRSGVISFYGGYHGRTNMTLGLTGKVAPYKIGFGPFPAEVYHAPYPNTLHGISESEALAGLERLLRCDIDPSRVAAMVIEPVQGEGGFYITPPGFLQALRRICDQHGIVLVIDEVQSGFARTGRWLAIEHSGVVPDLVTLAKSLAGGLPLSAVTGRADIMDAPAPGGLGGTYAGSPLALAAARAALDVIESEQLCQRAEVLGARLCTCLHELAAVVPQLADVRALGAMVAAEFLDPATRMPDAAFARSVQQIAMEHGLILLTCGMHSNVLRFLFPLTIEDPVFDEALAILSAAMRAAASARQG